ETFDRIGHFSSAGTDHREIPVPRQLGGAGYDGHVAIFRTKSNTRTPRKCCELVGVLAAQSLERNAVTASQNALHDLLRYCEVTCFRFLAGPLDHRQWNSFARRRLDQKARNHRPMTTRRPFAGAEEDNPAMLPVRIKDELQQIFNSARVRNLDATTAASDTRIAEFSQPMISVLAGCLLERSVAKSRRTHASGQPNVGKN